MASVVNIYNMALSKIGVTQRVSSLTEETEQRRTCSLWYEQCRDQVLRAYPWGFARTSEALALLSETPPPGWGYAYAYPTSCLLARAITTAAGCRASSLTYRYEDYEPLWINSQQVPFTIQYSATTSQRIIATDLEAAYLVYTRQISDTTLFDPLFVNALACLLASEAGRALRADARLVREVAAEYQSAIAYAAAMTQNERAADRVPDSPSISVR